MKKQLVAVDMKKVGKSAFVIMVVTSLIPIVINAVLRRTSFWQVSLWDLLICAVGYVALIIIHELLHAAAHLICGMKPSDIKFGFIPKIMAAYCYGKKPLTAGKFRFVLILPVIVTGIVPLVFAAIHLNFLYVLLFSSMTAGGAGDFAMLWLLKKHPSSQIVKDHPFAPAFYLLYDENNIPNDFIEVTEEQENVLKYTIKSVKKFSNKK